MSAYKELTGKAVNINKLHEGEWPQSIHLVTNEVLLHYNAVLDFTFTVKLQWPNFNTIVLRPCLWDALIFFASIALCTI